MLGPIPRWFLWCIYSFLPKELRPSPTWERLGTQQNPYYNFCMALISGLQSFANVQASRFARHPGCTYRKIKLGSRGFYVHAYLGLLPLPSSGYANRLNRAIDGVGTFTPLDSQPCRLLPHAGAWEREKSFYLLLAACSKQIFSCSASTCT